MGKDAIAYGGASDRAFPSDEYLGPMAGRKIVPAVPASQASRPQLRPVLPIEDTEQRERP